MKKLLVLLMLLTMAILSGCSFGTGDSSSGDKVPAVIPESRIVDTTNTLSDKEKASISKKLQNVHDKYGAEMVVVMVNRLGDQSIESYSMNIAEQWKVGEKDVDNGLILVIAKSNHQMRLEVGMGLEGTVTDSKAKGVIDAMKDDFRHSRYAAGIEKGIDQTVGSLDPAEAARQKTKAKWDIVKYVLLIIIAAVIFCLTDDSKHKGRKSGSYWHSSGSSGSSGGGFSGGGSSGGW